jgi:hypothetical protein
MIQQVVRYMQNKLDAETIFQSNYGLTELIERDGKVFPLFYESNGKYKMDFQPNKWFGASYFRKNGDISFSTGDFPSFKPCEVPVTITIPLTFIGSIRKAKLKCDDNYAGDDLAFYIAKIFEDINGLRIELSAKRVTFAVGKYSTDSQSIINTEFRGVDVVFKPEYAYLSMEIEVQIQTTKECMFNYCGAYIIDEDADYLVDSRKNRFRA